MLAQALEAFSRRHRYDAIVSWGERIGLPLAAILKATGSRTPHVALFSWISTPKKAAFLRRVHSHIHRLVVWSSIQYDFAVNDARDSAVAGRSSCGGSWIRSSGGR